MSFANPKVGPRFAVVVASGIAAFLIVASGALPSAAVHADTVNLTATVITPFTPGGCGTPPTTVFDNSNPADPGLTLTIPPSVRARGRALA